MEDGFVGTTVKLGRWGRAPRHARGNPTDESQPVQQRHADELEPLARKCLTVAGELVRVRRSEGSAPPVRLSRRATERSCMT